MENKTKLEDEGGVVKKLLDPKLPIEEEVEKHWVMGHIPYRNWCPICVRSPGKEMDHQIDKGKERILPECSWDCCFPGDELGYQWTVLVGKERGTGSVPTGGVRQLIRCLSL